MKYNNAIWLQTEFFDIILLAQIPAILLGNVAMLDIALGRLPLHDAAALVPFKAGRGFLFFFGYFLYTVLA